MKDPFWYYNYGNGKFVVEDRRTRAVVAENVPRTYVHELVDALNLNASARREPPVRELLRAYE